MQYTIEERKQFYIAVLEYLLSDQPFAVGMCWVLQEVGAGIKAYYMGSYFPELLAQRPSHLEPNEEYWFEQGVKHPRIEALKKAIELCDTALKQKES